MMKRLDANIISGNDLNNFKYTDAISSYTDTISSSGIVENIRKGMNGTNCVTKNQVGMGILVLFLANIVVYRNCKF